jgi:SAM-dependent methyltransferase
VSLNRLPLAGPPLSPNAWLRFSVLRRMLPVPSERASFVEVGCGQGSIGERLSRAFDYVGYEPDGSSYQEANERVASGTVLNSFLPSTTSIRFDYLGAFEVLEHIEDDDGALRSWREWLVPGGHIVLSVPAGQHRFGPSDVAVGHFRRYDPFQLAELVRAAGFADISIETYGFPLGYFLEFVRNRISRRSTKGSVESRTARSGRFLQPGERLAHVTRFATAPFRLVQFFGRRWRLGTGLVLVARRTP